MHRLSLSCVLAGVATLLPGAAQASSEQALSFVGIYEDARPLETVEAAVRRRLELLEVKVRSARPSPSCQSADCLEQAAARAPLSLAGQVLHATVGCVTTLWLHSAELPLQKLEVPCRNEWTQDQLGQAAATAAGELLESALSLQTPVAEGDKDKDPPPLRDGHERRRWPWGTARKTALIGLSLTTLGIALAAGYYTGSHKRVEQGNVLDATVPLSVAWTGVALQIPALLTVILVR